MILPLVENGYRTLIYGTTVRLCTVRDTEISHNNRSLRTRVLRRTSCLLHDRIIHDTTCVFDETCWVGQSYYCWLVHGLFPSLHIAFDLIIDLWQGGGIAAGFATKYPEMVDEKIILLAPTGLLKVGNQFYGVYSIDW